MSQLGDGVTAERVRDANFPKPSFGKRGYDDVRGLRCRKSALLSRGYDKDAVDRFMVQVIDALSDLEK